MDKIKSLLSTAGGHLTVIAGVSQKGPQHQAQIAHDAALNELVKINDEQSAKIAALESRVTALEATPAKVTA